jgi:hypothetical protein
VKRGARRFGYGSGGGVTGSGIGTGSGGTGGADRLTVSVSCVECVRQPLFPVTTSV